MKIRWDFIAKLNIAGPHMGIWGDRHSALVHLIGLAISTGKAYVSTAGFAERMGMSTAQGRRLKKKLVELGLVTIEPRLGDTDLWDLTPMVTVVNRVAKLLKAQKRGDPRTAWAAAELEAYRNCRRRRRPATLCDEEKPLATTGGTPLA